MSLRRIVLYSCIWRQKLAAAPHNPPPSIDHYVINLLSTPLRVGVSPVDANAVLPLRSAPHETLLICILPELARHIGARPVARDFSTPVREPSRTDSGTTRIVNEYRRLSRQHIVRVQARPLLPASLLVSGRFDSRRMFVLVRWSLLVLPSLLPSGVCTAWGIPGILNACQAALSCGVRLMVRSAPRA